MAIRLTTTNPESTFQHNFAKYLNHKHQLKKQKRTRQRRTVNVFKSPHCDVNNAFQSPSRQFLHENSCVWGPDLYYSTLNSKHTNTNLDSLQGCTND